MSVTGYFDKHRPELRLPREGVDPATGIRYEGDILTPKFTVQEALYGYGNRSARVFPPEALDPVLRFHLGIAPPPGPKK